VVLLEKEKDDADWGLSTRRTLEDGDGEGCLGAVAVAC